MTFTPATPPRDCTACGSPGTLQVIESRPTAAGRRRRHQCTACGYRDTTHEIPQALLEQLQADSRALAAVRDTLVQVGQAMATVSTAEPTPLQPLPCTDCQHATGRGCDLDLPEAHSRDAIGCAYHQPAAAIAPAVEAQLLAQPGPVPQPVPAKVDRWAQPLGAKPKPKPKAKPAARRSKAKPQPSFIARARAQQRAATEAAAATTTATTPTT